jgi:hypothetical protein
MTMEEVAWLRKYPLVRAMLLVLQELLVEYLRVT